MAKVPFKYYVCDDYSAGELAEYLENNVPGVPNHVIQRAAAERPFYEVKLECTLNTETGEVELVRASL